MLVQTQVISKIIFAFGDFDKVLLIMFILLSDSNAIAGILTTIIESETLERAVSVTAYYAQIFEIPTSDSGLNDSSE